MANNIKVGRITTNPLCGLCEIVCIDARTVYDGCIRRYVNVEYSLPITINSSAVAPYSFVSVRSNGVTLISNLVVTQYDETRSRVSFTSTIPVTVTYTDANNVQYTALSQIVIDREVLLRVPTQDFTPYSVEVATNILGRTGRIVSTAEAVARACIAQVVRIIVKRELLIPTYGDCVYPECDDFSTSCQGLFSLPVI